MPPLYGRKALVPSTCNADEALLWHALLSHLPDKTLATLHRTPFICWKEIVPSEDATRFELVDELYAIPARMPTTMYQFASWLEDWMTKLLVADEVSAHTEPRRAMAVLMNVGKPFKAQITSL